MTLRMFEVTEPELTPELACLTPELVGLTPELRQLTTELPVRCNSDSQEPGMISDLNKNDPRQAYTTGMDTKTEAPNP